MAEGMRERLYGKDTIHVIEASNKSARGVSVDGVMGFTVGVISATNTVLALPVRGFVFVR